MYADDVNFTPRKALDPLGAWPSKTIAVSEHELNASSPNSCKEAGKEISVRLVLANALLPIVFIVCGNCTFTSSLWPSNAEGPIVSTPSFQTKSDIFAHLDTAMTSLNPLE